MTRWHSHAFDIAHKTNNACKAKGICDTALRWFYYVMSRQFWLFETLGNWTIYESIFHRDIKRIKVSLKNWIVEIF